MAEQQWIDIVALPDRFLAEHAQAVLYDALHKSGGSVLPALG